MSSQIPPCSPTMCSIYSLFWRWWGRGGEVLFFSPRKKILHSRETTPLFLCIVSSSQALIIIPQFHQVKCCYTVQPTQTHTHTHPLATGAAAAACFSLSLSLFFRLLRRSQNLQFSLALSRERKGLTLIVSTRNGSFSLSWTILSSW